MIPKVDLAELDEMLMALRAEAKLLGLSRSQQDRIDAVEPVLSRVAEVREKNARRQTPEAGTVEPSQEVAE